MALALFVAAGCGGSVGSGTELLHVSYDPTRELWRDVNEVFIPLYEQTTGIRLTIKQSHGGSSTQARAILDGLDADIATLALWSDTDSLRVEGLLRNDWDKRQPNGLPYISTIVFVVRKGNPKQIKDWTDLIRNDVQVITPNPKTSGNGKLSFLAAWGAVRQRGGSEDEALAFVKQLYTNVPVLDTGARGSSSTFAQKGIGDVHLTWENEAYLERGEAKGQLDIVYPSCSIRAEPYVAVVDDIVDYKGTRAAAEAYLRFLSTEQGQQIFAKHYYRPTNEIVLKQHTDRFPQIELYRVTQIATDWDEAQRKFFADGAIFDSFYKSK